MYLGTYTHSGYSSGTLKRKKKVIELLCVNHLMIDTVLTPKEHFICASSCRPVTYTEVICTYVYTAAFKIKFIICFILYGRKLWKIISAKELSF